MLDTDGEEGPCLLAEAVTAYKGKRRVPGATGSDNG